MILTLRYFKSWKMVTSLWLVPYLRVLGSFKIDHPLPEKKDTHSLYHSFIEGPRADLNYRGTAELSGGWAQVDLDESADMTAGTWELLCRDPQCWIQNDSGWSAVRGSVEGSVLTIECADSDSSDSVSWLVVAERCDEHMMETDWTDETGKVIVEQEKVAEPPMHGPSPRNRCGALTELQMFDTYNKPWDEDNGA
jgi:hypothetical protein